MMLKIESAGISDIGRRRKQNEDSMFLDDRMGLYVVADGMGGHNAGEVASKLVVETIQDYIRQNQSAGTQTFQKKPGYCLPASSFPTASSIRPL
jgi:serine/threonine protein phosphatase PrpC